MTSVLVDSSIFLDVMWGGSTAGWSEAKLAELGAAHGLAVNPVIWSEIGAKFASQAELDRALFGLSIERLQFSYDVAFRAGQVHRAYRQSGGQRERTLPDFFIGAHAEIDGHKILTRDTARYRSYFPTVMIIAPDTRP